MPELIDRHALLKNVYDNPPEKARMTHAEWCRKCIYEAPIIEAEPVKHGRWILCEDQSGVDNDNNNYAYFCSQCHHQDVHSKFAKVNFCWNCGSKMQAEQPESEVQDDADNT